MNILIIGGTRFQGPYLVKELLDEGHLVTVFHRGSRPISGRAGLTELTGDRNNPSDVARIAKTDFDTCIDTCAYFPRQIDMLAGILKVKQYCLISSVHAYVDQDALLAEDARLEHDIAVPDGVLTPQNYGALKVQCEKSAKSHFGNACLILRPSIIVGPGDHTERLAFWIRLIAKHRKRIDVEGERVKLQLLDVRDLAQFTARCAMLKRVGTVNVCPTEISLGELLDTIVDVSGAVCDQRWLKHIEFASGPLANLPYLEGGRCARYDNRRAVTWGFSERPLTTSMTDVFARVRDNDFSMRAFHAQEAAVLDLFS